MISPAHEHLMKAEKLMATIEKAVTRADGSVDGDWAIRFMEWHMKLSELWRMEEMHAGLRYSSGDSRGDRGDPDSGRDKNAHEAL